MRTEIRRTEKKERSVREGKGKNDGSRKGEGKCTLKKI